MTDVYTCTYRQLFDEVGAPVIPTTYEATLFKNGKRVKTRTNHWRRNAESQCLRWNQLHGATVEAELMARIAAGA